MCCLTAVIFGIHRSWFQDLRPSMLERQYEEGTDVKIRGTLSEKKETPDGWKLCLEKLECEAFHSSREKILIYLSKDNAEEIPGIGQRLTVSGEISFYQNAPNPGNFNQKFYYQKRRIHACLKKGSILHTEGKTSVWKESLWKFRRRWTEQIIKNIGQEQGQMLAAMLFGDKQGAEELTELYQKTGIGHLLAVSGLHVSFMGMGIYRLLRKMGVPICPAAVAGLGILAAYVELCGSGVSARRAFVMFAVQMGAEISGRVYDRLNGMAVAAVLLLAEQPLWLFDSGFLLSFGAVLAFAGLLPVLKGREKRGKLGGLFLPAAALQMVLYPIMLHTFYEISPWSVFWNLLAVPLAPVIFSSGLLGGAVGMAATSGTVQKIAGFCSLPAFWGLSFYEAGSRFCLRLPASRIITGKPEEWKTAVYAGALLVFFFLCFVKNKMDETDDKKNEGKADVQRRRVEILKLVSGGLCLAAAIFLGIPAKPEGLEITMLDVGQGDCFVIRTQTGGTYLVDGGSSTVSSVGKYRMESWMKYQGIRRLDMVFLSHGDADHMSGIQEMLERQEFGVPVKRLIVPPERVWDEKIRTLVLAGQTTGTHVSIMNPGTTVKEGELELTCFGPEKELNEAGNEASMILSLQYGGFSMLFTGDVEGEGEKRLLEVIDEKQKTGEAPGRYTVLKCAHHGSKNGTSETFLRKISPKMVLISAGSGNRYGHPHPETLERLEQVGSQIYCTKESGAATIWTDGKACKIRRQTI